MHFFCIFIHFLLDGKIGKNFRPLAAGQNLPFLVIADWQKMDTKLYIVKSGISKKC